MGTVISNIVDITAYRRYRAACQQIWKPSQCAVCKECADDNLNGWIYSYQLGEFVCSEPCYEKAEVCHEKE